MQIVNKKCEYLQHLAPNVVQMFLVTPIITAVTTRDEGVIMDCVASTILNAYPIISEYVIERNQCVRM